MGSSEHIAFTIPEAVAATKLSRSEIYRAFHRGDLTPRKAGRRTVILRDELLRYMTALPLARAAA